MIAVACLALGTVVGCSGDDGSSAATSSSTSADASSGPRFCDVYLDYLADSSPENLRSVDEAADDPQVHQYATVIESGPSVDELLAATLDLDDLARSRCQTEWTAGAQGAGNTGAAAQALLDALVAGDRDGARNVASANAIAVFEPWEPIPPDPEAGTPALGEVGGQSFSIVLSPSRIAECDVETGVIVACQIAE